MNATFPAFMAFGAMSILLLVGVFIRAKVKFIQNLMIPSSLFAGVLGFIAVNAGWLKFPYENTWMTLTSNDFMPFAFHAFTISFISLCLTRAEESNEGKSAMKGGLWLALMWTASLTVQALVGAATIFGYNLVSGDNINLHLGYLVTHGFTQGPGQGMAVGGIWASQGVPDAVSMGLIWASFGFMAAYVVGVPVARGFVKREENANKRSKINSEFSSGLLKKDTVLYAGRETTHSANIDTLAYHIAIIGLVYVITYFEIAMLRQLFPTNPFFNINFFFFHGLGIAMILRALMKKLGIAYLTDPGVQKRITGFSVDFLLVASIMAISFEIMSKYIGVIIAVTITVSTVTFFMIRFFQRGLGEFGPERALSSYGCCTGSAASGLVLLRILDADYSTPVAMELAVFNVAIGFTTMPIMLMVPMLPQYAHWVIFGAYILNTIVCFGVVGFLGLGKKHKPAT